MISLMLVLFSAQATADIRLYGEARLGAGGVRHSDLDFYPTFGSFSAGVFVFGNIGIEGFVDAPLSDGERDVFELGITQASGAAIRLQSPAQRGLQAYVLIGYVDFTLKQTGTTVQGTSAVKESFEGVRVSVGVHQQLQRMKGLSVGVEYRNFYADSGITVDGLSAGLRFEMQ